ncbi:MAG: hypothetical protein WB760_06480 [Xanthobacteraceae bacterium]
MLIRRRGVSPRALTLVARHVGLLGKLAANVMAGELAKCADRHREAFQIYETLLRGYIGSKQRGAERFSSDFAPKTRWGLFLRNQVIKACAIPGLSRFAFGRDVIDKLQLPDYRWPCLAVPMRQ